MCRAVLVLQNFAIYSALIWVGFSAPILSNNHSDIFQLISSVHDYFRTSCVFLAYSNPVGIDESYEIGEILRKFSAKGVLAIAIEFTRLNETLRFYANRIVRALVVVPLRTRKLITEFSGITASLDMATSCWLLIINDRVFVDYFSSQRSDDNTFHLSFATELLVARTHHTTIQEWYFIHDKMKIEDLAEWNFASNFTLKSNESIWERRVNLEDSPIVVTVFHNPPMITLVNNTIGGLFGLIISELSIQANFNMEFITPRELSYGSWNSDENRWTGMMEMLTNGKADVAAADFTITTMRLNAVDFSLPLISTREKLYIRQPSGVTHWTAYWQAFVPELWIFIELLIVFTTLLLTLFTAIRGRTITLNAVSADFLFVLGIYCQQGLPEFPIDLPSRIAYFSILLNGLVISAAYSASLVSFITTTGTSLPFSTLEEFAEDKTHELIVFRDSADYDMFATSTEPTIAKMWSKMKIRALLPVTLMNGFQQVCDGNAAFYVSAALEEIVRIHLPCKVVGIDTKQSMVLALALSKGNQYNRLINYHVQRFRDNGILGRLKGIYEVSREPLIVAAYSEVTVGGIMLLLAILAGGVFLSVVIFYLEKICSPKLAVKSKRRRIQANQNGVKRRGEIVSTRFRDTVINHSNLHPRHRRVRISPLIESKLKTCDVSYNYSN